MKLYVLFGQRKCTYDGQYAPEALAIADEWTMDENPQYIGEELDKSSGLKFLKTRVNKDKDNYRSPITNIFWPENIKTYVSSKV